MIERFSIYSMLSRKLDGEEPLNSIEYVKTKQHFR